MAQGSPALPAQTAPSDPAGDVQLRTLTGDDLRRHLPDLAALRAAIFRDWPYLYDADPNYEADYNGPYAQSPAAALILATAAGQPIGAATCLPLADETANLRAPFVANRLDPTRIAYFGESVLRPEWRGRGIGVAFFERREAHARAVGAECACFCAVQRPPDHPLRPPHAPSLAQFWTHRGYTERPDLTSRMTWSDVGQTEPTEKTMVFWLKPLRPAANPLPNS